MVTGMVLFIDSILLCCRAGKSFASSCGWSTGVIRRHPVAVVRLAFWHCISLNLADYTGATLFTTDPPIMSKRSITFPISFPNAAGKRLDNLVPNSNLTIYGCGMREQFVVYLEF